VVIGVSGGLRGSAGRAVERYEVLALDRERQFAIATGEIHLDLSGPQVAAER
jgi:hypothetical protein